MSRWETKLEDTFIASELFDKAAMLTYPVGEVIASTYGFTVPLDEMEDIAMAFRPGVNPEQFRQEGIIRFAGEAYGCIGHDGEFIVGTCDGVGGVFVYKCLRTLIFAHCPEDVDIQRARASFEVFVRDFV